MDGAKKNTEKGEGMSLKQAYRPFFQEYALLAELNLVRRQQPVGLFVIPSSASALMWFGVIFVRQGHYEGGAFKFTIYIPDSFPDCECPTVIFESPPFHPMISPTTGEFDSSKSFAKWKRGTNHLWQLLLCLRRCFYQVDVREPFNTEAANLYENDINMFKHKASESVKLAKIRLLDAPSSVDPHALAFQQLTEEQFDEIHTKMTLEETRGRSETRAVLGQGLSWVRPGSKTAFSKTPSPINYEEEEKTS